LKDSAGLEDEDVGSFRRGAHWHTGVAIQKAE